MSIQIVGQLEEAVDALKTLDLIKHSTPTAAGDMAPKPLLNGTVTLEL